MTATTIGSAQGISEAELTARRARGEGNAVPLWTSRFYGQPRLLGRLHADYAAGAAARAPSSARTIGMPSSAAPAIPARKPMWAAITPISGG